MYNASLSFRRTATAVMIVWWQCVCTRQAGFKDIFGVQVSKSARDQRRGVLCFPESGAHQHSVLISALIRPSTVVVDLCLVAERQVGLGRHRWRAAGLDVLVRMRPRKRT